jgi:hypothetical protein
MGGLIFLTLRLNANLMLFGRQAITTTKKLAEFQKSEPLTGRGDISWMPHKAVDVYIRAIYDLRTGIYEVKYVGYVCQLIYLYSYKKTRKVIMK